MKYLIGGCIIVLSLIGCSTPAQDQNTLAEQCPGIRSDESIKTTIDIKKAGLYLIYRDYLQNNPDMRGKIVFDFSITPEGLMEDVSIANTEFDNAEFNQAIKERFMQIRFHALDVCRRTLSYTFYFMSTP
ncbi:hypothetical protein TDB9533_04722 [Thalassocella blandensis]|nr:hypothetical protein TDB9533_04722 [Thalassocella blandensis]